MVSVHRKYDGERFEREVKYSKPPSKLNKSEIIQFIEENNIPEFFASPLPRRMTYVEIGKKPDGEYIGEELSEKEMKNKSLSFGPDEIEFNTYYNQILNIAIKKGIVPFCEKAYEYIDSLHVELNHLRHEKFFRTCKSVHEDLEEMEEYQRIDWNVIKKIEFTGAHSCIRTLSEIF